MDVSLPVDASGESAWQNVTYDISNDSQNKQAFSRSLKASEKK